MKYILATETGASIRKGASSQSVKVQVRKKVQHSYKEKRNFKRTSLRTRKIQNLSDSVQSTSQQIILKNVNISTFQVRQKERLPILSEKPSANTFVKLSNTPN